VSETTTDAAATTTSGLPTLTEHITPLGTWIQITPDYQAEFLKQVDASSMGELCQDGTRKDEHR